MRPILILLAAVLLSACANGSDGQDAAPAPALQATGEDAAGLAVNPVPVAPPTAPGAPIPSTPPTLPPDEAARRDTQMPPGPVNP